MDPRADENPLFRFCLLIIRVFILRCYCQVLTPVTCQGPTESASIDEILRKSVSLNPGKIVSEIRVCVREAVSEIDLVRVMIKSVSPRQSVVVSSEPSVLSFQGILRVVNIFAHTVPAQLLVALS